MAGNRPSVLFSRVRDVLQPNSAGTGTGLNGGLRKQSVGLTSRHCDSRSGSSPSCAVTTGCNQPIREARDRGAQTQRPGNSSS